MIRASLRRAWGWASWLGALFWWGVLALHSAMIFALSSRRLPRELEFEVGGLDKLAHAFIFGLWASLCLAALSCWRPRAPFLRRAAIAVGSAAVYGLIDEVHQGFVEGRTADPWDLVADAIGAAAAAALWAWVRRFLARRD